jgi:hypothetical protein
MNSANTPATTATSAPTQATTQHLIDVLFDQDRLLMADHFGQPYVVMKPLVRALDLDWRSQYEKLTEKFGAVMVEITTTGADGKRYPMVCLPLRKLPAWLYSINTGKVSAALRPKVIRYQEECDEVLWRHWTGTYVAQNQASQIPLSRLTLGFEKQHVEYIENLGRCTSTGQAKAIYQMYVRSCQRLGMEAVPMEELAFNLRQAVIPGV